MICPKCQKDNQAIAKFCVKCGFSLSMEKQSAPAVSVDKNAITKNVQMYEARGQYDKAIAEWNKLIEARTNDAMPYNAVGDLYRKINAKNEAMNAYKQAAEIIAKQGHISKAIALYKKILSIDANQTAIYVVIGDLNAETDKLGDAIDNYKIAYEQYAKKNETVQRLSVYQKMADVVPSNTAFRMKLAEQYVENAMNSEAVKAYVCAAAEHVKKDDLTTAHQILERALAVAPENRKLQRDVGTVYVKWGDDYYDKKRCDDALICYNRGIELNPDNGEFYVKRGKSYLFANTKQLDNALADFNTAINLNPGNDSAYFFRGMTHQNKKQYDNALADYNKAIELNSLHAEAHMGRGFVFSILENYDQAVAEFTVAIKMNPKHYQRYRYRGDAYCDSMDYRRALTDYKKALKLNPDYAEAHIGLACVYSVQNRLEEACEYLKIALEKGYKE